MKFSTKEFFSKCDQIRTSFFVSCNPFRDNCSLMPSEIFYQKTVFLKIFRKTPVTVTTFFIELWMSASNFINKETLEQKISWKFYDIFKNTFFFM